MRAYEKETGKAWDASAVSFCSFSKQWGTAEGFGALKCDQRASLGDESFGDIWDRSERVKQSQ